MLIWHCRKTDRYIRNSLEETLAILPAGVFSYEGHKDTMTDKEAKKFYNSTLWKHKRMQILERDHYECQDCRKRLRNAVAAGNILRGEDRKIRRAEEVHHIVELKEHPELGLEDDNLISLCVKCHNLRHGRTPRRFQRKKKLASKERW